MWLVWLACQRVEVTPPEPVAVSAPADPWEAPRAELVETLRDKGVGDEQVLAAIGRVPRQRFVPGRFVRQAYVDEPLPIGLDQTISQPLVVARMTELVMPVEGRKTLEIGTGSGYQAAVLAELGAEVTSLEILCDLADSARERLGHLGYQVTVHCTDGWAGWPEGAPYEVILVTAAPETVPPALLDQLAPGGRLVAPVGSQAAGQVLTLVERDEAGEDHWTRDMPVRFVPMTGGQTGGEPANGPP